MKEVMEDLEIGEMKYPITRRGGQRVTKTQTQTQRGWNFVKKRKRDQMQNAMRRQIRLHRVFDGWWWRGRKRRRLLRRQKRRASGASLILPNMGCTSTRLFVFWRHLGGLPFFLPFSSLFLSLIFFLYGVLILDVECFCLILSHFIPFSIFYFLYLQYLHLHLSSTPSVTLGTDLGLATWQRSKLHIILHIPLLVIGSVDFCQIKICTTWCCMYSVRSMLYASRARGSPGYAAWTAPEAVDLEQWPSQSTNEPDELFE